MKKILSLRNAVCLFTLLLGIGLFCPHAANAQQFPQQVVPVPLYRFIVPGSNYGFFLTANYQEGINRGYYFNATIGAVVLPPGPGWTPAPGQGLVAMHRWRVAHRAGTNYALSADFYPNITSNPENTYDGLMGYGLLPSTQWGGPGAFVLHLLYSTTNGYYYDTNGSMLAPPPYRPNSSYNWQGVAYRLPNPGTSPPICGATVTCYTFNPPPQAPICDANQEQACYTNGGAWNSNTCSCSYLNPPPGGEEPQPECRPGMICRDTLYNPQ
jgi:hypothetical protein